jgi:hypothetical protein
MLVESRYVVVENESVPVRRRKECVADSKNKMIAFEIANSDGKMANGNNG